MDFALTDEQRSIVEVTRAFVERELYPHEEEVERTGVLRPELAAEIRRKALAAGLYAGWTDFRTTDAPTRQHSWEVWAMLLFVFNGVVFLLLGLSLSHALIRLGPESFGQLALHALALWAALGAIRMAWVFPAAWLAPRLAVQSGNAPRAPPA